MKQHVTKFLEGVIGITIALVMLTPLAFVLGVMFKVLCKLFLIGWNLWS